MPEKIKLDVPCPKCGKERYFRYIYPNGTKVRMCLDCKSNREKAVRRNPAIKTTGGRKEKAATAVKHFEVAALLGHGATVDKAAEEAVVSKAVVVAVKKKADNPAHAELNAVYRAAKHSAAQRTIPMAEEVMTLGLQAAKKGIQEGIERVVGKNKETGEPIIAREKPNLMHLSSMVRETAFIVGVGRGGVLESEDEKAARLTAENESKPTVTIKMDPRVLAAALRHLDDYDHEQKTIEVEVKRE